MNSQPSAARKMARMTRGARPDVKAVPDVKCRRVSSSTVVPISTRDQRVRGNFNQEDRAEASLASGAVVQLTGFMVVGEGGGKADASSLVVVMQTMSKNRTDEHV